MTHSAVLVTLISFAILGLAYVVYGRFLARRIFRLDDSRPTPAHTMQDGVDYVPTRVPVLFGHHFASIAGLGPILGPAIAVIWGWLPAVIWVVVGSVLIGAVHDLGALTVSLRYRGRSIGDVTRELIGPRARFLFLLIIFFLMSLAMGVFVLVIAQLFVRYYPSAIVPSLGLMVVAMAMGVFVYRFRWPLGPLTLAGVAALFLLIHLGVQYPVQSYEWFADDETRALVSELEAGGTLSPPYGAEDVAQKLKASDDAAHQEAGRALDAAANRAMAGWTYTLLLYGFAASVLPVWLLLQPRDYLNSYQLYAGLALLVVGMFVLRPTISAPAVADSAQIGAPSMFPFLFITIACGAISGFHSLVSSGTTVRQLRKETDALPIGFGAMLTEGALAVLVIMACVAGLGAAHWGTGGVYSAWQNLEGNLSSQLAAVVQGGGEFLAALRINRDYGEAFIAVAIVAFALTTLDSATRLLRYNVEELLKSVGLRAVANRYTGSLVAVIGIGFFALLRVDGKPAGIVLWQMFGTTNQLLAGLTLVAVSLFLFKLRRPVWYTVIPMLAMLFISLWAMSVNLHRFWMAETRNWPLIVVSVIVLGMTLWLLVEAALSFARGRDGFVLPDEPGAMSDEQEERDEAAAHTHLG
jgi:carbon starvation protein